MFYGLSEKETISFLSIIFLVILFTFYFILHIVSNNNKNFNNFAIKYNKYFQLSLIFFATVAIVIQNINDKFPIFNYLKDYITN